MIRRITFGAHLFEYASALVWFMVGAAYLTDRTAGVHSPVGYDAGIWQVMWSTMYLVAGPCIWFGLSHKHLAYRVGGLNLLGAGLTMQFVVAVTFRFDIRDFNYLIYMVACALKMAHLLLRRKRHGC